MVQRFTVPGLPDSADQATPERYAQAKALRPGESDFGRKPNREPWSPMAPPKAGKPLNREPLNHAVSNPSSQAHVLLVDDEVSVLDISTFILRQNGYAVSMASSAKDALVMLNGSMNSSNPVDLVITDLTMPVMSGVDFIREMRKRDFLMPVVVATGSLESYSEPEIKNIEADQILVKPFNPTNLTDCVKTILARQTILARKGMGQSRGDCGLQCCHSRPVSKHGLNSSGNPSHLCHSRGSGNPESEEIPGFPIGSGMTENVQSPLTDPLPRNIWMS